MGVAETERALSRVAEERQKQRDLGYVASDFVSPLSWAGGFALFATHAVEAAFDGDVEDFRESLIQIAAQAVALLEMPDEQVRGMYELSDDDEAAGSQT